MIDKEKTAVRPQRERRCRDDCETKRERERGRRQNECLRERRVLKKK